MCLTINIDKHPDFEPIVLREDKVVWKTLGPHHVSLYRGFHYKRRKGPYTCPPMRPLAFNALSCRTVSAAFHAFLKRGAYVKHGEGYRFIVPAGSHVFYGMNGDICSDKIIFPLEPDPTDADYIQFTPHVP